MTRRILPPIRLAPAWLVLAFSLSAAADIGQIKTSKGQVSVERAGQVLPGEVGTRLEVADVLKTGADGTVGITMRDNSLLSAGPNSILALQHFEFDATTSQGRFDRSEHVGHLDTVRCR